jgi:nicotinate-nucleotide adenylyltransferase
MPSASEACRIALFGGSFDPPHLGHLAIARRALQALALDKVFFAPVGQQPLKPGGHAASFEDRVAMVRLAIANDPSFELSLVDAPNPQGEPNYTIDALGRVGAAYPHGMQLYLLLGADALRGFARWHRAAEIPFLATLIVASRPHEELADMAGVLPEGLTAELRFSLQSPDLIEYQLQNDAGSRAMLYLLPQLNYEISATEIRSRIHSDATERDVIPDQVLAYIREHHLYE